MGDLPPNASGYDLMAGTGEVWPHLLKAQPGVEKITAIDISSGMYEKAMDRLHQMRQHKIEFIRDNILDSELANSNTDFVISTFGLKTFNMEQMETLAKLIARILKPGGKFSLIEASDPKGWILRPLYLFHLKIVLPVIEKIFLRGATDFRMIGIYSTNFGNARAFADLLREQGLSVQYQSYFFGCASGVSGYKP